MGDKRYRRTFSAEEKAEIVRLRKAKTPKERIARLLRTSKERINEVLEERGCDEILPKFLKPINVRPEPAIPFPTRSKQTWDRSTTVAPAKNVQVSDGIGGIRWWVRCDHGLTKDLCRRCT